MCNPRSLRFCLFTGTLCISEPCCLNNHLMAAFNLTPSDTPTFILTGIPGLEDAHAWIAIPFATCYTLCLLGNFSVLFMVGKEQTLHQPMYLFFCMLALTDIVISTCVVPKALGIFWFNLKGISLSGCLTQTTFLNVASLMQAAVLVAMAFDRYVAICNPLRYATILSNARIAKLGLVIFIRGILCVLPVPLMLSRLPFCDNRIIPHTYCEGIAVAKISCGDHTFLMLYDLVMLLILGGIDLTLIGLSYCLIIRAVLRISSKKAHQKALNTCMGHISVMLMSFTFYLFSNLTHRFGQGIAPHVHIILSNVYLLVPPMLNPIIYGVKTKEFHDKMRKNIFRR
ncbi:olfactory receptor 52P1-like [Pelodiscus sinensis]|uniref:olfactory receptor 52P1-like n=1 Tax=Pelodiscus sinensis TaxID=13735 RepID=UPI003F6D075F